MSGSSDQPWSDGPNAPKISSSLYFGEKVNFVGDFIAIILYGIVIVLFFQCTGALLNPINRRKEGIRWGLVVHTTAMFSFVTIATAMGLNLQSISRIDNREFPGVNDGTLPPGPFGYKYLIYSKAISIIPNFTFQLNQWLADGLLLYRCYVIYALNRWVISFPCLMYFTSLVTGILYIYKDSHPGVENSANNNFGYPYFTISLSLNILLTLMIVTRLILHNRNIQNVMGATASTGRLYKAIVVMLIESSALYGGSCVLYIGPWIADSALTNTFWPILNETQVIAPLLIVLRVANRSALTGDSIVSGDIGFGSIRFRSGRGSTGYEGTHLVEGPLTSTDVQGETPIEPSIRVETVINEIPS